MSVFLKLAWFFRQERKRYCLALLALVGIALLIMIPPWLTGKIVDEIANKSLTEAALYQFLGSILAVALVVYGLRVVWRIALFGASYTLAKQLRQRLFAHLTTQSPEFFGTIKPGTSWREPPTISRPWK